MTLIKSIGSSEHETDPSNIDIIDLGRLREENDDYDHEVEEEDEESELEEDESDGVQLGFVIKSSKNQSSQFKIEEFPCKVGGRPLWLNPTSVLKPSETKCEKCNDPMVLLIQLYTAEDFPEEAYHRYLYLWACPKGSCHKRPQSEGKSFRLFRAQLPLDNPYYITDPDTGLTQLRSLPTSTVSIPLCAVCGVQGTYQCSQCEIVYYCSRLHQKWHWCQSHSTQCHSSTSTFPRTTETTLDSSTTIHASLYEGPPLFPEYQLDIQPEPSSSSISSSSLDSSCITTKWAPSRSNKNMHHPHGHLENDDPEETAEMENGVDPVFFKFQSTLAKAPSQVLRYLRTSSITHPPLLIQSAALPSPPNCPHCLGKRTLECQLISTLVYYLDVNPKDPTGFEFDGLFLFTCDQTCTLNGTLAEEIVECQFYSPQSLGESFPLSS